MHGQETSLAMKRLLDDYILSDAVRYEAHTLIYSPANAEPVSMSGIMAAAVLWARLDSTDEGELRGIALETSGQREELYMRYEREVRHDNGGLITTEVEALRQAYIAGNAYEGGIDAIYCNERLYDLAMRITVEYMERLVREEVGEQIYDYEPWHQPFAQWLYDAAFAETYRQQLLHINFADATQVYELAESFEEPHASHTAAPTLVFEGLSSDRLIENYYNWLWAAMQAQTAELPNAEAELAQLRPELLKQETDRHLLEDETEQLPTEDQRLFRQWLSRWEQYITAKWDSTGSCKRPPKWDNPKVKQVLFLDDIMTIPKERSYTEVCKYIEERCRYDEHFNDFYKNHTRVDFCNQLTAMFGWLVDPNHLGARLNYKKKY